MNAITSPSNSAISQEPLPAIECYGILIRDLLSSIWILATKRPRRTKNEVLNDYDRGHWKAILEKKTGFNANHSAIMSFKAEENLELPKSRTG